MAATPKCSANEIARGQTCTTRAATAARIDTLVRQTMRAQRLKAAIVSVRVDGRNVVTRAYGQSMTGVPARTNMRFRNGSIAISYLGTLALRLQERGVIDLDEPIERWLPRVRDADRVTPRMLLLGTSGYRDYVGYAPFNRAFYANPFRNFTEGQLIAYAMARPSRCAPGECWGYSHANFVILGQVLSRAAGRPLGTLLRREVLRPAGLTQTRAFQTAVVPEPVLHAFTAERGTYEESTFWNPSWTLARGAVQVSTIRDVVRSAEVIGGGRLLTPASYAQFVAPSTAGFAPWSPERYYALGIVSSNSWLIQNPSFAGQAAAMGYPPSGESRSASPRRAGRAPTARRTSATGSSAASPGIWSPATAWTHSGDGPRGHRSNREGQRARG